MVKSDKSPAQIWEEYYQYTPFYEIPWQKRLADQPVVDLVKSGKITPCKVLDLGCAVGANAIYLAKKGFEVTAIDISPMAIYYCRQKARERKVLVNFQVADVLDLPFPDSSFEFILDWNCFQHIRPNQRRLYLENILRVSTPNAKMLLNGLSEKNSQEVLKSLALFLYPIFPLSKDGVEEIFGPFFEIKESQLITLKHGGNTWAYWNYLMIKRG